MMGYIWQNESWTDFTWDKEKVDALRSRYLYQKGIADGTFSMLSEQTRQIMIAETLSRETVSSSAIEGVELMYDSVYSSIIRQLDIDLSFKAKQDRNAESVSRLIIDANSNRSPLSVDRLFDWHRLLFDGVAKGFAPRTIGAFRTGPIYIVHQSQKDTDIIYEGIPTDNIASEMDSLISYINSEQEPDYLIRSAVASFWFVSIHPFEDGNGRISRAIADYVLSSRSDTEFRPYSISEAIIRNRKGYYDALQAAQKSSSSDITDWLVWYIDTVCNSLSDAVESCRSKLRVSSLMKNLDPGTYNSRQMMMLYRLADGSFYGKLTAEKWMKMTKCQSATATRDLSGLAEHGLLLRMGDGGKGTYYILNPNL